MYRLRVHLCQKFYAISQNFICIHRNLAQEIQCNTRTQTSNCSSYTPGKEGSGQERRLCHNKIPHIPSIKHLRMQQVICNSPPLYIFPFQRQSPSIIERQWLSHCLDPTWLVCAYLASSIALQIQISDPDIHENESCESVPFKARQKDLQAKSSGGSSKYAS